VLGAERGASVHAVSGFLKQQRKALQAATLLRARWPWAGRWRPWLELLRGSGWRRRDFAFSLSPALPRPIGSRGASVCRRCRCLGSFPTPIPWVRGIRRQPAQTSLEYPVQAAGGDPQAEVGLEAVFDPTRDVLFPRNGPSNPSEERLEVLLNGWGRGAWLRGGVSSRRRNWPSGRRRQSSVQAGRAPEGSEWSVGTPRGVGTEGAQGSDSAEPMADGRATGRKWYPKTGRWAQIPVGASFQREVHRGGHGAKGVCGSWAPGAADRGGGACRPGRFGFGAHQSRWALSIELPGIVLSEEV